MGDFLFFFPFCPMSTPQKTNKPGQKRSRYIRKRNGNGNGNGNQHESNNESNKPKPKPKPRKPVAKKKINPHIAAEKKIIKPLPCSVTGDNMPHSDKQLFRTLI